MALTPDRDAVLQALDRVRDPESGAGLVRAGLVRGLSLSAGRATFMLEVEASKAAVYAPVRAEAEAALARVKGVEQASVALTVEGPTAPARAQLSPDAIHQTRSKAPVPDSRPAHVRRVVAVASGKGGVGKSTVAINLACAMAQQGWRVGLLDADVYGPSAPTMLGLAAAPEFGADKKMIPESVWGLKAMSIGVLVGAGQALVWRGPMASQALTQMLNETRWGTEAEPLDVLVVDLPPGTGDVHLTLVQRTIIDGVVIVSTPQESALADVRRGVAMFQKVGTRVLGLVENMAYFRDSSGVEAPIFGRGGARLEAERLGVAFLGEIPLEIALREGGDLGRPVASADPQGATAHLFGEIAGRVVQAIERA